MSVRGEAIKKQFFAGTACPYCKVVDKIRRCEDAVGVIWMECLACGYTQDITDGYIDPDEEPVSAPVRWQPAKTKDGNAH